MTNVPQEGFFFDGEGSKHDYYLDGKKMTGVTTILGVLAKPALIPWAARMAVEYIEENTTAFVDKLVVKNGKTLAELFTEAKGAHARKRDEGGAKGTSTHALVEEWIKFLIGTNDGKQPDHVQGDKKWEAITPFMEWARKENIKFLATEKQMYSKSLFVAGTADFIFEKDGKRYIGDLKTYKKIWDRVPFYQCAGYAYMWEEMNRVLVSGWPNAVEYKVENPIHGYCIVNLPKERSFKEDEDVLWSFDVAGDTKAFLACVEIYRQNANFTTNKKKK